MLCFPAQNFSDANSIMTSQKSTSKVKKKNKTKQNLKTISNIEMKLQITGVISGLKRIRALHKIPSKITLVQHLQMVHSMSLG